MASVFLSYDRDDLRQAQQLARALEAAGHAVWWDLRVRGGAQFSKAIEEALESADAVVVLWSKHSIESAWVRDEAAVGRDTGRLVPVSIDATEPPLGFRQFQTIDFSNWSGRGRPKHFSLLADAISSLANPKDQIPQVRIKQTNRSVRWPLLGAIAVLVLALIAGAFLAWRTWHAQDTPAVEVIAADSSSMSAEFARDLVVKLGSLQSAQPESLQIVDPTGSARKADLLLQVSGKLIGSRPEGTLGLYDARNRSVLWSENFDQPGGSLADLKQQLAASAARVLDCASEAVFQAGSKLSSPTLKSYLGTCSSFASASAPEMIAQIPQLRSLLHEAPRLKGAWGKLLIAESNLVDLQSTPASASTNEQISRDIGAARKLDPKLPEAFLAEYTLLPRDDLLSRGKLLDQAVERNPNSAVLLDARAAFLGSVGRMGQAVQNAQRAAQMDPVSPAARDDLISALAAAGRLDAALEALDQAEKWWPGASNLQMAKFRINLRFGDPKVALALLHSGTIETSGTAIHEDFLEARINPTPENVDRAIRHTQAVVSDSPDAAISLIQTLAQFGREDELVQMLLNWRYMDRVDFVTDVVFRPAFRDLHRDPRFMAVAAHLGLLNYWRWSGSWPDFCFEPDLPYDCKKEAARVSA